MISSDTRIRAYTLIIAWSLLMSGLLNAQVNPGTAIIDPTSVSAGENVAFTVIFTAETSISEGGGIRIYFGSSIDHAECEITVDPMHDCGFVEVSCSNDEVILETTAGIGGPDWGIRLAETQIEITAGTLNSGDTITMVYGAHSELAFAQDIAQASEVTVLVKTDVLGLYREIDASPVLTIRPVDALRLNSAISVQTGQLVLSILDRYMNRVDTANPLADIYLLHESGTELFIGHSRFSSGHATFQLPDVGPGCYIFRIEVPLMALSSRIPYCPGGNSIYFGDIHFHSKFSDTLTPIDPLDVYESARNASLLDFASLTDHAECIVRDSLYTQFLTREIPDSWAEVKRMASTIGDAGFVALLAYETTSFRNDYPRNGHMNVVYRGTEGVLHPWNGIGSDHLPWIDYFGPLTELWSLLDSDGFTALTIPHHPLYPGNLGSDFYYYHPDYMRLVEIYSEHGCSESPDCINTVFDPALDPYARGSIQRALGVMGYRMGFIASSDNHLGRPGGTGIQDLLHGHSGGLAAVIAPSLTREGLYDALTNRSTYATTGVRMILEFTVNGLSMGREIQSLEPPVIHYRVAGTAQLDRIEVVKFDTSGGWRTIHDVNPGSFFGNGDFMDEAFSENSIYYLRVHQSDGHMAWSSPVWVDRESSMRVGIELATDEIYPGDEFWVTGYLINPGSGDLIDVPVFFILGIADAYYFWPGWTEYRDGQGSIDYRLMDVPRGSTAVEIIPSMIWPNTEALSGLRFFGAMLTPEMDRILGDMAEVGFGVKN